MKILILCTGNSCRSQMAQGFLQSLDKNIQVFSAGTEPAKQINSKAVQAMLELGIDISKQIPKHVDQFRNETWDYVITVCGGANETCPAFFGTVKNRLHIGFEDPSDAVGTEEFIRNEFRRVRDEIKIEFDKFYLKNLKFAIINPENLKLIVKKKYSEIALQSKEKTESSCCGVESSCCGVDYTIFSESYEKIQGYNSEADLGLGCGIPTTYAKINKGNTVIDLGSGAGNDCFVARAIVGDEGKVIGLDMTEAMIKKAVENADKLGFDNVHFLLGEIEKMPVSDNIADVVISNCVLNLVPDKQKAFAEIYRVLKCQGHFSISDIVLNGKLPSSTLKEAEMYAGCVSGAIQKDEYLSLVQKSGFINIAVQKEKQIIIPDEILLNYITNDELIEFKKSNAGIFSINVYAEKP